MTIVSWELYSSLSNKITQTEFPIYEQKAERKVKSVIGKIRWDKVNDTTFGYSELQDCIVEVADAIYSNEQSGAGKGLASVSNDGYSETYNVRTETEQEQELTSLIIRALSGTGLVGAY